MAWMYKVCKVIKHKGYRTFYTVVSRHSEKRDAEIMRKQFEFSDRGHRYIIKRYSEGVYSC